MKVETEGVIIFITHVISLVIQIRNSISIPCKKQFLFTKYENRIMKLYYTRT